jgi:hypothetical protein
MPSVGFETTISAGERTKTYALDRAATGTGVIMDCETTKFSVLIKFQAMTVYGAVDMNCHTFINATQLLLLTVPIIL